MTSAERPFCTDVELRSEQHKRRTHHVVCHNRRRCLGPAVVHVPHGDRQRQRVVVDQRLELVTGPGHVHVTLFVHDARGAEVEQDAWSGTSRAAGWNLASSGSTSTTAWPPSAFEGKARTSFRTQGAPDLHRRFDVEIHPDRRDGTFAPTLNVDLTDLGFAEDALITAEVRCDLPFDVDDTPQTTA